MNTIMAPSIYMLKIVFIGPESSGKTTLCKLAAEHFSTCWVPEMCRIFAEERLQLTDEINFILR